MWVLKKKGDDKFFKTSEEAKWIHYKMDGNKLEDFIAIGRSLVMSPFNDYFTWMTTPVTKIIKVSPEEIEFKTKNSHYFLTKEENDTN